MLKHLLKPLSFILIFFLFGNKLSAQANNSSKKLRVAVAGSEPFVFDQESTGIAAEIWDKIAEKKSLGF